MSPHKRSWESWKLGFPQGMMLQPSSSQRRDVRARPCCRHRASKEGSSCLESWVWQSGVTISSPDPPSLGSASSFFVLEPDPPAWLLSCNTGEHHTSPKPRRTTRTRARDPSSPQTIS